MRPVVKVIWLIQKQTARFTIPSVTEVSFQRDPYLVLISCMLSLRTKDKTTIEASRRLFKVASTVTAMLGLSKQRIQKLIYPVGFYRNKARNILCASGKIVRDFSGAVPRTLEELLTLTGVGRKTANLVLGLGYGIPAICVDIHVHRITNRLGWVETKDPQATEEALQRIVPRKYWIMLNTILVGFGQNICLPVSPLCSKCGVRKFCKRTGVVISR